MEVNDQTAFVIGFFGFGIFIGVVRSIYFVVELIGDHHDVSTKTGDTQSSDSHQHSEWSAWPASVGPSARGLP